MVRAVGETQRSDHGTIRRNRYLAHVVITLIEDKVTDLGKAILSEKVKVLRCPNSRRFGSAVS
jgi:uncharacterized protein YaaR (DUF327 family)